MRVPPRRLALDWPKATSAARCASWKPPSSEPPGDAELYSVLGAVHARAGNRMAAVAAYRRYLALAPAGREAERIRRRLQSLE